MINIIIDTFILACITFLLGVNLTKNGLAACLSAFSFVGFIGFAYMIGEYTDNRAELFILYAISLFPLLSAIYRYNKWKEEQKIKALMEFVPDMELIIRHAADPDKSWPEDDGYNGRAKMCAQSLRLFINQVLPLIAMQLLVTMRSKEHDNNN